MNKKSQRGQSLVEVLVGLGIISITVGASTYALVSILRTSNITEQIQSAGLISNSLLESVSTLAEANWNSIYNLQKTSSNHYFLVRSSTTTPTPVPGDEGILEQDIANGLVGYWKFDENSGTGAYDSSGNGNLGALINIQTRVASTSCKIGKCLSFDGVNNHIDLGNPSSLDANIFTFTAWIKPASVTQGTIFGGFNSSAYTKNFVRLNGGKIGLDQYLPIGGSIDSNTTLVVNNWYHIVAVQNGSYWAIYVNGVLDNSNNNAETYSGGAVQKWVIGRREYYATNYNYFSGLIDDARLYNRALSSVEITQLYNSPAYSRYFYIDNVNRKACGSGEISTSPATVCSGSANDIGEDPATQKITIGTSWNLKGANETLENSIFVTRWINSVTEQSDWGGSDSVSGAVSDFGDDYSEYSGISTTTTGTIKISGI